MHLKNMFTPIVVHVISCPFSLLTSPPAEMVLDCSCFHSPQPT